MPLGGGAPRDVLEDVVSADWTPDGRALAAIQVADGEYQLQFPIGKSLYTTPASSVGWRSRPAATGSRSSNIPCCPTRPARSRSSIWKAA